MVPDAGVVVAAGVAVLALLPLLVELVVVVVVAAVRAPVLAGEAADLLAAGLVLVAGVAGAGAAAVPLDAAAVLAVTAEAGAVVAAVAAAGVVVVVAAGAAGGFGARCWKLSSVIRIARFCCIIA